ncbi:ParB/RepB/Spo0J family partition protein [Desulfosporosinus nitroreducens]|uniref:ParB/RepB/Spo0J family partition protein n=1 Tax=Desulfosporosinus nitroreducens TaxID=2018668 RepID=A0ABT8QRS9_9FIRM|nr:ParB/RepB/Spo0J family partition protein [Desulfosporosinus nitroreducens]MDO0824051.1 ParB/RepB/Spo0J family partition protein [Desulfosporosinus nitroreducens]
MIERKLLSLEDMFGGPIEDEKPKVRDKEALLELEIGGLVPFNNHPFKLYTGQRLNDMVESIRENGVIQPIVVRNIGKGKYEILAGHNRVNASRLAGLTKIRADIRENISDDEAALIVTISNFEQRSSTDMLPSELAKSLKMQLEAAKATGKKQELLNALKAASNQHEYRDYEQGAPVEHRGKSVEKIADNNRMSRANIQRYIRLNFLIEGLLDRVDEEKIALRPAVYLSYLSKKEQQIIEDIISINNFKIDMVKAERMKGLSEQGKLSGDNIYSILSGEDDKKPKKSTGIKLKPKLVTKFFHAGQKPAEIEQIIEKALSLYFGQERGTNHAD